MRKQRQRQHRLCGARLAPNKECAGHHRNRKTCDHNEIAPAARAALDQAAREGTERDNRRGLTRQVDLTLLEARGLRRMTPGEPQAGQSDRQVDQEDRAPADQRDQCSADERAGRQRQLAPAAQIPTARPRAVSSA